MRCERCGAYQASGDGYCRACDAPLNRVGVPRLTPMTVVRAGSARERWLSFVALAAIAILLLICLVLAVLAYGLSALIQWAGAQPVIDW